MEKRATTDYVTFLDRWKNRHSTLQWVDLPQNQWAETDFTTLAFLWEHHFLIVIEKRAILDNVTFLDRWKNRHSSINWVDLLRKQWAKTDFTTLAAD